MIYVHIVTEISCTPADFCDPGFYPDLRSQSYCSDAVKRLF